jgi:hypothetical protein
LFVNELWSSSRRKTSFVIIGLSFMAEGNKGKVSLGYIDAFEAINLLHSNYVRSNVNGPARINLINALYSRRYTYSLVQFGKNNFRKDPLQNERVINKAFNSGKIIQHLFVVPNTKEVYYDVIPRTLQSGDPGQAIFEVFEKFLNENREVFFNKGGHKYFDFKTYKSELAVTRVEIYEIWEKVNGRITYNPHSIKLFVNNKELDPIRMDEVKTYNLLFNFRSLTDALKEKNFEFQLTRINGTFVATSEADDYKRGLMSFHWSQISYYIKYFKQ